jgi:hypothetical protein
MAWAWSGSDMHCAHRGLRRAGVMVGTYSLPMHWLKKADKLLLGVSPASLGLMVGVEVKHCSFHENVTGEEHCLNRVFGGDKVKVMVTRVTFPVVLWMHGQ